MSSAPEVSSALFIYTFTTDVVTPKGTKAEMFVLGHSQNIPVAEKLFDCIWEQGTIFKRYLTGLNLKSIQFEAKLADFNTSTISKVCAAMNASLNAKNSMDAYREALANLKEFNPDSILLETSEEFVTQSTREYLKAALILKAQIIASKIQITFAKRETP